MASKYSNVSINNSDVDVSDVEISSSGLWKNISFLEEEERARRAQELGEEKLRVANAKKISDGIRSQSFTIKARLIQRPILSKAKEAIAGMPSAIKKAPALAAGYAHDLQHAVAPATAKATEFASGYAHTLQEAVGPAKEKAAEALHHAYDSAISAVPSKEEAKSSVSHAWDSAKDAAAHAAAPVADKTSSALNSALDSANSYVQSLLVRANSFKDNLISKLPSSLGGSAVDIVTLAQIKVWEETERARRVADDKDGYARANAKRVSKLIEYSEKISFKVRANKGYSQFITLAEESERKRRISNIRECEQRRFNAAKITADDLKAKSSKAKLSSIKKDFEFEYKFSRELEDKERRFRSKNKFAEANARKEAKLIADIGSPFYRPRSALLEKKEIISEAPFSPAAVHAQF